MSATVMMSELTWSEYSRRLKEEDAVVFLPVGAVEQHGYHMAMGTDWMLGTYMARRAAERVGGIVAPPITYAARSQVRTGGGPHRMGSVNLRSETLIALWTPDAVRGRVNAVNQVFVGASNELGEFRAGTMAALIGTVPAVVIGGVGAIAVAGLWAVLFPQLRDVRRLTSRE